MTTLSVLVPTYDQRRPLARCLESCAGQMKRGDEVIVIGDSRDGPLKEARRVVREVGWKHRVALGPLAFRYEELDGGHCSWGHDQLNYGLSLVTGDYVLANDDDDVYVPTAFQAIREAVAMVGPKPLLFRFRSYHGAVYWAREGVLEEGLVGGHCAVFPNDPAHLGKFGERYNGDWDYIASTVARLPGGVADLVWLDEVIAVARPTRGADDGQGGRLEW